MRVITKDITTVEKGVLINGVNCQRAMGRGVARAYFTKWPQVRKQYMEIFKEAMYLGQFDPVVIVPHQLYVANCWTQEFYGSDGAVYADYGAILASLSQAAMFARKHGLDLDIYTPWIGCGLGGLEQNRIKDLLEWIEEVAKVHITVCEI
jgi:O-acetyl-ADP-ribose deacetylase (regulator of RNase III)